MFFLVCFDIVDDKNRRRAVKVLKNFGVRVQKSVFECADLDERSFLKMKSALEDEIDLGEDTFRFYFICEGCLKRMEYSGIGDPPETLSFKVV